MSLKYRTSAGTSASNFTDLVVKVGDTLPIGSEIDYDGQTAPAGWQEVSETNLGDVVVDSIKTKNLFNKNVGTDGYLTSSGNVVSNPDHIVSDYVNIDGISSITISGSQGTNLENCFYDSSKTVIGHFALSSASTTQEVPSGTKYIRLTVKKTALDTYQLEGGSTATNYTSYFDSNNIGQMKVGNSTLWDGWTNDLSTYDGVNSWIPVLVDGTLKHTTIESAVDRGLLPQSVQTTAYYGCAATCYKIGKLCIVSIIGPGSSFTQDWTDYILAEIPGITAKSDTYSTFSDQQGRTGDIFILQNSNQIRVNYRGATPDPNNAWLRGQLVFVTN